MPTPADPRTAPHPDVSHVAVTRAGEGPRVVVMGCVHGNEPVGGPVIERLLRESAEKLVRGTLVTAIGNPEARERGVRHTAEGQNLNRLFDPDSLAYIAALPPERRSPEQRRAHALAPVLREADCIFDLHSTSRPSTPFLLFRDDRSHRRIAQHLGVGHIVTGVHESGVLPGGLAANIDLRAGQPGPRLGFVLEAGQHQQEGIEDAAYDVVQRALYALGIWSEAPPPPAREPRVYEIVQRYAQRAAGASPWRFARPERRFREPRKLETFERIEAGELLATTDDGMVLRADEPFTMLMPTLDAAPGDDLFFSAQQRYGGLGDDIPADRLPAVVGGVERMMDLVDGDAFERGHTWACFDGERILGRCADLLGRVLRLPEGHPDRRVAVVGPGDFNTDEHEVRRGRRYRQAMRRVMAASVPIDRYQLLRGTTLRWLDALTSTRTRERVAQGDRGQRTRLFLSMRQPSVISVLVCGDLNAAIESGGRRTARVAIVIEAPRVSPDGDAVGVQVARAALFSGRPEVLRAVQRLITALRADHEAVVRRQQALGFADVLQDDGTVQRAGIELSSVRELLYRLQAETWARALEPYLHGVQSVPEGELGDWLAPVMGATGLRDAAALRRMVSRPVDGGWSVSPEWVARALAAPEACLRSGDAPRPPRSGREPLLSSDVDVDTVESWLGWKRRMHGLEVLPGTRGRDLDLPLTGPAIHSTLVRLYAWARKKAAQAPGEVMVVIAGDGQSPQREPVQAAAAHLLAHRAVSRDPNLRYLRIQHAEAMHLAWLRDWFDQVGQRPTGSAPVALNWEHEAGDTVNVVLIATRDRGESGGGPLDGWRVEAAGVLLSQFERAGGEYAVGLFTHGLDPHDHLGNSDMLQFARAHCEAVLGAHPVRWTDDANALRFDVVATVARWIELCRAGHPPEGLADPELREALLRASQSDETPARAAAALVGAVEPWPGLAWEQVEVG